MYIVQPRSWHNKSVVPVNLRSKRSSAMKAKLTLFAKVVSVAVFAFGAISYVSAQFQHEPPRSFVITYRVTSTENGQLRGGMTVLIVNADGQWKQTKLTDNKPVNIRFMDKVAAYQLANDRLDYLDSAEPTLQRDRVARSPKWITDSPLFVREDSIAGLKVYVTHQTLNDGWVEEAYSPLTRSCPLLERQHLGAVEITKEAVSVQFRDVSPDEIKPPDLPISFESAKALEKAMLSNPENSETVKGLATRREFIREKLKAIGRIERSL